MKFCKDINSISLDRPAAVSLGKFDGLHIGHRLLMDRLAAAKEEGLTSVAVTFSIPPNALDGTNYRVLSTEPEKEWIFDKADVDILLELDFSERLRSMEPETFLQMLTEKIPVQCIVAGTDFRFGKNRSGDYGTLIACEEKFGYHAEIVEKLQDNGEDISSTRIRKEVEAGNIPEANRLLGYTYFITGEVVVGNQLGRTIDVPTANLLPPVEKLLPPNGVYASVTEVDGKFYAGISNIGRKPTVGDGEPLGVETHLFGFSEDIYGKTIRVELVDYIRPEAKFGSLSELKEHMAKDMERSRELLEQQVTRADGRAIYHCGYEDYVLEAF